MLIVRSSGWKVTGGLPCTFWNCDLVVMINTTIESHPCHHCQEIPIGLTNSHLLLVCTTAYKKKWEAVVIHWCKYQLLLCTSTCYSCIVAQKALIPWFDHDSFYSWWFEFYVGVQVKDFFFEIWVKKLYFIFSTFIL